MAAGDLRQADFASVFAFSRSEAATYTDAGGTERSAVIDAPRFDHDADGNPRGLLVTAGSDIGRQDRVALADDALPEELLTATLLSDREATVFHAFVPLGSATGSVERRAWYTRNAKATVEALMAQAGHHVSIGVLPGLRENLGGYCRLRNEVWQLPTGLAGNAAGAALAVDAAGVRPLLLAGAFPSTGIQ
jgi:hypothetical protein